MAAGAAVKADPEHHSVWIVDETSSKQNDKEEEEEEEEGDEWCGSPEPGDGAFSCLDDARPISGIHLARSWCRSSSHMLVCDDAEVEVEL